MPTVAIYVAAALTTVAAAVAFKQFVYEPHIAPTVERWTEEFVNEVRARRRQRQMSSEHNHEMSVSAGGVSDYTRASDAKAEQERRAKAASDWRQLTESVNELEKSHEQVGSTSAIGDSVATTGLRRRVAGPMDESIESLLFAPMSPSAGSRQSEPIGGPPPAVPPPITCPMPLARNHSNQSVSTLFSISSSSPSSQPAALASTVDQYHATTPRSLSPLSNSGTGSPSLYASAVLTSPPATLALSGAQSPRSPFSDFIDDVNPWVDVDGDAPADPPAFARSRTLSASEMIQDNTPQIPTLDISVHGIVPRDDEVFSLVDSASDSDPSDVGSDVGSDASDDFTQLLAASGELSQSSWTRVDDRSML